MTVSAVSLKSLLVAALVAAFAAPVSVAQQQAGEWQAPVSVKRQLSNYADRVFQQVKRQSALNLPRVDGQIIHGRVTVRLALSPSGKVESVQVLSSPSAALKEHTLEWLKAAGPFEPFPLEIAAEIDVIEFQRTLVY